MEEIRESQEEEKAPVADIVDVRFRTPGRAGAFLFRGGQAAAGDLLIVESKRGAELGEAIGPSRPRWPDESGQRLPRVLRIADENDLHRADHNQLQEKAAEELFIEHAKSLRLSLKLSRADFRFDGGKVVFYFIGPDRCDTRPLARDLAQKLHTRVEMRQLGPRESTQMIGGIGPCGRELCCSSWLRDFGPVSIKMAKAQDLSLNPAKLAGMCGRLKCCLRYEYDTYLQLKETLPRIGKKVETIHGKGVVVRHSLLKQSVRVELATDGEIVDCSLEELVQRRPREQT